MGGWRGPKFGWHAPAAFLNLDMHMHPNLEPYDLVPIKKLPLNLVSLTGDLGLVTHQEQATQTQAPIRHPPANLLPALTL